MRDLRRAGRREGILGNIYRFMAPELISCKGFAFFFFFA